MKNIRYSTKARKDLKRYVGFPDKMRKLFQVLRLLQLGFPIPPEFKPHLLVVRIGTHSELFKK